MQIALKTNLYNNKHCLKDGIADCDFYIAKIQQAFHFRLVDSEK